jgi:hypothetical protein
MPQPHPLRLDRSNYHSSVHGEFQSLTHYWQDGLPFDEHGHLVINDCTPEMLERAGAKAPKTASPPPSDPPKPGSKGEPEPLTEGDVNLELWAKGEARYHPGKVFAAIRERYSKSVTTFGDAIEFLVYDLKLIPASEASKKLLATGGATQSREEP